MAVIDFNTGDVLLYRNRYFLDVLLSKQSLCSQTRYSVIVSKINSVNGTTNYLIADRIFGGFKLRVVSEKCVFSALKVLRISSELSKPLRRCFRSELLKNTILPEPKRYFLALCLSYFGLNSKNSRYIQEYGFLNVSVIIDIFKTMGFDVGTVPNRLQTIDWLSHHKKFFEVTSHGH